MENKDRVIIFIDGSNLYHILRKIYGASKSLTMFNFGKFIDMLVGNNRLVRTYYYTAPLDRKKDEETYKKQQKFFEKLKKIPDFSLTLCRMQKERVDGKVIYLVKEDDIHLAVDMVKLAFNNAYDNAILVSSDGDFVPAVKAVQEIWKKVENIAFKDKFSWHLKQECDRFIQLNKEILDRCFDI